MKTKYQQIVSASNMEEILHIAKNENLSPAAKDEQKVLLLAIDVQNDFLEGGSLEVPGANEDVIRLTGWIHANLGEITQIICSLDTHSIDQIFHAAWWRNAKHAHPDPFTIITYDDVIKGKWIPISHAKESLRYLQALEQQGNKQLCIWPYHCLEGSYGADLDGGFAKMLYYYMNVRQSEPIMINKGKNPLTEMYGIIKAEYDPENDINTLVLDAIKAHDKIYVAGEAASHCVLASLQQIAAYFVNEPEVTKRITLLSDCTSSIPGFEKETAIALDTLHKKYGINIMRSVDILI